MKITCSTKNARSELGYVLAIYRKNKRTLGFMPKGAFEDAIHTKSLLTARNSDDHIVGYVLFRRNRGRAYIAHLCVHQDYRGFGIARNLIAQLKEDTKDLECITLKCRNDYEENTIWPKFGFQPRGTTTGRGADAAELTIWSFDHGHPDLFSNAINSKIQVAIDSNVFFDLTIPSRPQHKNSSGLTEPWLDEIIELVLTDEIYSDINRHTGAQREASRKNTTAFPILRPRPHLVDSILSTLMEIYPDISRSPSGISDLRHLAYTASSNTKYFITRDQHLLDNSHEVLQQTGLTLQTPSSFITSLDIAIRNQEYHPQRLLATQLISLRLAPDDIQNVITTFQITALEKKHELRDRLNGYLSLPRSSEITLTKDADQAILLSGHVDYAISAEISILRLSSHQLGPTVLRHTLMKYIRRSADKGHEKLLVSEPHISQLIYDALCELGFLEIDGIWTKPLYRSWFNLDALSNAAEGFNLRIPDKIDQLGSIIWPAKICSAAIPCYLIPIWPQWAEHFFDSDLAAMRFPELSDLRTDLHLGVEAVYYTASRVKLHTPGYIAWYVSQGTDGTGSKSVKAVSRLREVRPGTPKELFKRYQRLGVYDWKHVFASAKNCHSKTLQALRFTHTEQLKFPISIEMLRELGITHIPMCPRAIPPDTFKSIYHFGMEGQ